MLQVNDHSSGTVREDGVEDYQMIFEKYKALIESSDDAIVSKTLQGVITSWNPAATRIFGYSEAEMIGSNVLKLFPPERVKEEEVILNSIANGVKVDHYVTQRVCKSGNTIHVFVTVSPILDSSGKIVGASKIARDITERFNHHLTLQQYKSVVEGSYDAILTKDVFGVVQSWNRACEHLFGYLRDEIVGSPINILIPDDRLHEEEMILGSIQRGERIENFETVRIDKMQRRIDVSVTISPIVDMHGVVIGASKIVRNISLRKMAEQKMRLAESIFTHTTEGVVVMNSSGKITDVNTAFSAITGYAKSDVLGADYTIFRSGRQGPEVFLAMLQELKMHGRCQGEIWSRRKTGEAFAILLNVNVVPDPDNDTKRYVALFSEITEIRLQQEKLEKLANYDPLTNLPNRYLLADRLKQGMAQCRRSNQTLAVAYLDLDGFKTVNDLRGHDVGDDFLTVISSRMLSVIRESDTLARIGGDEFVIVLTDVGDYKLLASILERVLDACSAPVDILGVLSSVSASIGVSSFPDDDPDADADLLLRRADQAMYEAKHLGKNRFHLFDANRDARDKVRATTLLELKHAIVREELELYYQPKIDLVTGQIRGAEALIRWNHPVRGLVPPMEFLPYTEGHAVGYSISAWVIHQALRDLHEFNTLGFDFKVSINITPEHLKSTGFAQHLIENVAQFHSIKANQLELEIVESTAIDDTQEVANTIRLCRDFGLKVALDDFGTGYSSLTYLKQLRVDTLKIDQSFVRDMLSNDDAHAIVNAVIGLAAVFQLDVIAEGIESDSHALELIKLGCGFGQGYGIAKPMPINMFVTWVQSRIS